MSGGLKYTFEPLHQLGSDLHALRDELQGSDAHEHPTVSTLGHPRVVDAMHHFRECWDDRREALANKAATLGDLSSQAAEGFRETDDDLARTIRQAMQGGTP